MHEENSSADLSSTSPWLTKFLIFSAIIGVVMFPISAAEKVLSKTSLAAVIKTRRDISEHVKEQETLIPSVVKDK